MLNLVHLETFVHVLRAGSISRAAGDLHYAQSSVTAHIQALEREFNEKLLDRNHAGVTATPAGDQLHYFAQMILGLHGQLRAAIVSGRSSPVAGSTAGHPIGIPDASTVAEVLPRHFVPLEGEVPGGSAGGDLSSEKG
ncbi:LysR family transcriptional regulator [Frankia sp. Cas4]|uniref:LysR family transcriptional regulator n=1 Tax=Frankia sp. Cas4 TaxID=3073927 RepID=UPI002AD59C61|nr:LysR family transcriptional regulator [Frankia sp. Cas4]